MHWNLKNLLKFGATANRFSIKIILFVLSVFCYVLSQLGAKELDYQNNIVISVYIEIFNCLSSYIKCKIYMLESLIFCKRKVIGVVS